LSDQERNIIKLVPDLSPELLAFYQLLANAINDEIDKQKAEKFNLSENKLTEKDAT